MSLVVCPSCGRHAFALETTCPHCGQAGHPTLRALVVALGLATAACSSPDAVVGVYGPAPIDTTSRLTASTTASAGTAPAPPSASAPAASASATASAPAAPSSQPTAQPSAKPTTQPTEKAPPPVKVYGPPPRDPSQRTK